MSANQYVGAAALTMIRTTTGGYAYVYRGDPVPDNITDEDLKRLSEEKFIAKVDAKSTAPSGDGASKPTTIKDILAAVGDDQAKAQAALDEENASETPRTSLVEKLQAIANPGQS